jgi:hypothetical protein
MFKGSGINKYFMGIKAMKEFDLVIDKDSFRI